MTAAEITRGPSRLSANAVIERRVPTRVLFSRYYRDRNVAHSTSRHDGAVTFHLPEDPPYKVDVSTKET